LPAAARAHELLATPHVRFAARHRLPDGAFLGGTNLGIGGGL